MNQIYLILFYSIPHCKNAIFTVLFRILLNTKLSNYKILTHLLKKYAGAYPNYLCFAKKCCDWQVIFLAVIKHIKSHNANYSDALEYLLFQHNEKTGELLYDDYGQMLLRKEFYINGLNCDPYSFDSECRTTNKRFKKIEKEKISSVLIRRMRKKMISLGKRRNSYVWNMPRKTFPAIRL